MRKKLRRAAAVWASSMQQGLGRVPAGGREQRRNSAAAVGCIATLSVDQAQCPMLKLINSDVHLRMAPPDLTYVFACIDDRHAFPTPHEPGSLQVNACIKHTLHGIAYTAVTLAPLPNDTMLPSSTSQCLDGAPSEDC